MTTEPAEYFTTCSTRADAEQVVRNFTQPRSAFVYFVQLTLADGTSTVFRRRKTATERYRYWQSLRKVAKK